MTLSEILDRLKDAHVVVIGDAMRDHYVFGRVERICPEAPVPVFIPEKEEDRPGGAANVAAQVRALGCHTYEAFAPMRSVKTRYMCGQHMMLRVDRDVTYRASSEDVEGVVRYIESVAQQVPPERVSVILSDYARGWVNADMAQAAIKTKLRTLVDPKGTDWSKYLGCSLICPNEEEYAEHEGGWPGAMLRKLGARGMQVRQMDVTGLVPVLNQIPAVARRVYDVTGAGDCVIAVVAAAAAVGATYLEGAQLAALAAGYVVGEIGTTVCPFEKLKELVHANPSA